MAPPHHPTSSLDRLALDRMDHQDDASTVKPLSHPPPLHTASRHVDSLNVQQRPRSASENHRSKRNTSVGDIFSLTQQVILDPSRTSQAPAFTNSASTVRYLSPFQHANSLAPPAALHHDSLPTFVPSKQNPSIHPLQAVKEQTPRGLDAMFERMPTWWASLTQRTNPSFYNLDAYQLPSGDVISPYTPPIQGRQTRSGSALSTDIELAGEAIMYGDATSRSDPFGKALDAHLLAAQERSSFSRMTLSFIDKSTEHQYRLYFLDRMLKIWRRFAAVAIVFALLIQSIFMWKVSISPANQSKSFWDVNKLDIIVLLSGVVPMATLLLLSFQLPKRTLSRFIHVMSVAFIWLMGPLIICGRTLISPSDYPYPASFTSPLYIVAILSGTFFFRLRFVYTLLSLMVVAPFWYSVFGLSLTAPLNTTDPSHQYISSSIALALACVVVGFVSYDVERGMRLQFLSDQRFLKINIKLQNQLKGLQKKYSSRLADLDSPLEKAIYGLKYLMASPMIPGEHIKILDMIMSCLNSQHLLTPDLDQQVKQGHVQVDPEQEKWLFNEIATRGKSDGGFDRTSASSLQRRSRSDSSSDETCSATDSPVTTSPRSLAKIDITMYFTAQTLPLLSRIGEFNFPIFDFANATMDRPLMVMTHHLVTKTGIMNRLALPMDKFLRFISTIEEGYHADLTYHNSIHATDVLHCINYIISLPNITKLFTDLEILALFVAAAVHDYDHPGVNNNFLISTNDRRALLYNDRSVLENHHCASAFEVLMRKECNFLGKLDRKVFKGVRDHIVAMVLATDLSQHFSLLTMFKKKVVNGGGFDPLSSGEDKSLLMQMLMKCADVSNPTKSWPIYCEWIKRITEEFFSQGDQEKQHGLPISPFCNRDAPSATNPASSQKSFIEFIVAPLFEALCEWQPMPEVQEGLERNRNIWGSPAKAAAAAAAVAAVEVEAKKK